MRENEWPALESTGACAALLPVSEFVDVGEVVENLPPNLDGLEIFVLLPQPKRGGTDTEPFHHLLLGQEYIVILLAGYLGGVFSEDALRDFAGKSDGALVRKGQGDVLFSSRNGGHELFGKQPAVIVGVEFAILDGYIR